MTVNPIISTKKCITISPRCAIDASIDVPGSKSISNRALLLATLAHGRSHLSGILASEDTIHMQTACKDLGASFDLALDDKKHSQEVIAVDGVGHQLSAITDHIYIGNAGTAARFLTSILCTGAGLYTLTGNERMHERPISDLVDALRCLGAKIEYIRKQGFLPIKIYGTLKNSSRIQIKTQNSSQYVSALLLLAPLLDGPTVIELLGPVVSRTYIEMTIAVMKAFGVTVNWQDSIINIAAHQTYKACHYQVEPDASSASYWFAAAVITGGSIRVTGLSRQSNQGDLGLLDGLARMGAQIIWHNNSIELLAGSTLSGIDIDMNTMSDVAPTLAVVAAFAQGTTRIRNVAHMRIKECDRIAAMATELKKKGVRIYEHPDGWEIHGGEVHDLPVTFATYNDHRMAMALSLIGLRVPGVQIENPSCVSKTYPHYFEDLQSL